MRRDTGTLIESHNGNFVMSPRSNRATRTRLSASIIVRNITVFGFFNFLWDGCSGRDYLSWNQSCGGGSPVISTTTMGFSFSGIDAPGAWTLISGSLPPGLSLDDPDESDNEIDLIGTPSANGTYTFKLKVANNLGEEGEMEFTMRVKSERQIENLTELNDAATAMIVGIGGTTMLSDGLLIPCGAFGTFESFVGGNIGQQFVGRLCADDAFPGSPTSAPLNLVVDPNGILPNSLSFEYGLPYSTYWEKDNLNPDPVGDYNYVSGGLGGPSVVTIS